IVHFLQMWPRFHRLQAHPVDWRGRQTPVASRREYPRFPDASSGCGWPGPGAFALFHHGAGTSYKYGERIDTATGMTIMDKLLHRFLRYVRIDTQANEASKSYPSTPNQLVLGKMLQDEL